MDFKSVGLLNIIYTNSWTFLEFKSWKAFNGPCKY